MDETRVDLLHLLEDLRDAAAFFQDVRIDCVQNYLMIEQNQR